jgi:hypothetical protein
MVAKAKAKQALAVAKAVETRISHLETVADKAKGDKKSVAEAKLQVAQARSEVSRAEAKRAQQVPS